MDCIFTGTVIICRKSPSRAPWIKPGQSYRVTKMGFCGSFVELFGQDGWFYRDCFEYMYTTDTEDW